MSSVSKLGGKLAVPQVANAKVVSQVIHTCSTETCMTSDHRLDCCRRQGDCDVYMVNMYVTYAISDSCGITMVTFTKFNRT